MRTKTTLTSGAPYKCNVLHSDGYSFLYSARGRRRRQQKCPWCGGFGCPANLHFGCPSPADKFHFSPEVDAVQLTGNDSGVRKRHDGDPLHVSDEGCLVRDGACSQSTRNRVPLFYCLLCGKTLLSAVEFSRHTCCRGGDEISSLNNGVPSVSGGDVLSSPLDGDTSPMGVCKDVKLPSAEVSGVALSDNGPKQRRLPSGGLQKYANNTTAAQDPPIAPGEKATRLLKETVGIKDGEQHTLLHHSSPKGSKGAPPRVQHSSDGINNHVGSSQHGAPSGGTAVIAIPTASSCTTERKPVSCSEQEHPFLDDVDVSLSSQHSVVVARRFSDRGTGQSSFCPGGPDTSSCCSGSPRARRVQIEDPNGESPRGKSAGFRYAPRMTSHVTFALGVDGRRRSSDTRSDTSAGPGRGGGVSPLPFLSHTRGKKASVSRSAPPVKNLQGSLLSSKPRKKYRRMSGPGKV
ncbi:unnamed protein product [Trypanosoma congolense IL3000]|uniref:WGS project CAEQ00000000 data, annotated contig 1924 n=1 Tax=Trypanosoma congolense (strain IL3000) TaxID=1068625 RepID=F9WA33_TRYCI|nr:unnamed protein product [Trypanosoma congolense IL3000]